MMLMCNSTNIRILLHNTHKTSLLTFKNIKKEIHEEMFLSLADLSTSKPTKSVFEVHTVQCYETLPH